MTPPIHHKDDEIISKTHNLSRYCIENPQIAWVLLIGTVIWGIYGYLHMPQRKDPDVPPKQALVVTPWPGANAQRVEDLVTRTVEKTIASNSNVSRIESVSRSNVSTVTFTLSNQLKQTAQVLDDLGGRLAAINDLPQGAGPINYVRDFGDTATLLLTVASPRAGEVEIALRARAVRDAIQAVRPAGSSGRASLVFCFPPIVDTQMIMVATTQFVDYVRLRGTARDIRIIKGTGFVGIDGETPVDDKTALEALHTFLTERYGLHDLHPDQWQPFLVRDLSEIPAKLAAVAGEKYSYREMEDFTDLIEKALLATARTPDGPPLVAKVIRYGILPEKVYLVYSQQRLASYG
ncbi:MAG TPA: efflux RND transporter permease subunit, partial [Candidatus Methylomirabilis sp.]|nr:efflux RND transporter permease subunit [Candidatus Methylomirabilis sp.]